MDGELLVPTGYPRYFQLPRKLPKLPEYPTLSVPLLPVPTPDLTALHPLNSQSLALEAAKARTHALTTLSGHHADIASAWLYNRGPGERHIRIDTAIECRRCGCCGEGERIRATTQISIW